PSTVFGIIENSVIGAAIVRGAIAISTALEVCIEEKFQVLGGGIAEPGFRENCPEIELVVDLPINSADWSYHVLFKRIHVRSQDAIEIVTDLETAHGPDREIKGICGDMVSGKIKAGLKLKQGIQIVATQVGNINFCAQAGQRIGKNAVGSGEIEPLIVDPELKVVLAEQMEIAKSDQFVAIDCLRSERLGMVDLAAESVVRIEIERPERRLIALFPRNRLHDCFVSTECAPGKNPEAAEELDKPHTTHCCSVRHCQIKNFWTQITFTSRAPSPGVGAGDTTFLPLLEPAAHPRFLGLQSLWGR